MNYLVGSPRKHYSLTSPTSQVAQEDPILYDPNQESFETGRGYSSSQDNRSEMGPSHTPCG